MRLFVAVELPEPLVSAAAAVSETLRARIREAVPAARLTWVALDRMHLTIRFIGDVPVDAAGEISHALSVPLDLAPFTVAVGETGTFPPRGAPRVVWLGLTDGHQALRELEAQVSARLERAGIAREARPFNPHLTLARVRDAGGLRPSIVAGVTAPPARGPVDAVTLFESRLSPNGPAYTALQRTVLQDPGRP